MVVFSAKFPAPMLQKTSQGLVSHPIRQCMSVSGTNVQIRKLQLWLLLYGTCASRNTPNHFAWHSEPAVDRVWPSHSAPTLGKVSQVDTALESQVA